MSFFTRFRRGSGAHHDPAMKDNVAVNQPGEVAPRATPHEPHADGRRPDHRQERKHGFARKSDQHSNAHQSFGHHVIDDSTHFNRRPRFGQWLKVTWPDILTMVCMGLIGLGVYEAHPAPSRSFPLLFQDGSVVYPEFAYPLRHEIIPIWAAAMLGVFVPIVVFFIVQIRVRSFWDMNNAVIGLLYSLICAAVFQVFLKWLIGGLRPHFLEVCRPDEAALEAIVVHGQEVGNGFRQIMFDRSVCTGDKDQIDDSLESFPSGHTTAAFAGFVYLYLYLNGKLKVFANYHPAMWKLIAIYAPLLGATLIGGALTIDEFHNWYDILAGAIIGTVFAFSSYRMLYASVWDFRFNHIPLMRHTSFNYGVEASGYGSFATNTWTRQVGWGSASGGFGGAPFDSSGFLQAIGSPGGGGNSTGAGAVRHTFGKEDHGHNHASDNEATGRAGRHSHDFHQHNNQVHDNDYSAGITSERGIGAGQHAHTHSNSPSAGSIPRRPVAGDQMV